jgi:hypothetical protein
MKIEVFKVEHKGEARILLKFAYKVEENRETVSWF